VRRKDAKKRTFGKTLPKKLPFNLKKWLQNAVVGDRISRCGR
jgi:hypothetical protein